MATRNATAGSTIGVEGSAASATGKGVYGHANATAGATIGVEGSAASTTGRGVYGHANATSGTNYGVYGQTSSPGGYALYGQGRLKVTARSFFGTPNSAPVDADLEFGFDLVLPRPDEQSAESACQVLDRGLEKQQRSHSLREPAN